jgi:heme/copper-type cytochrome/quinol oxidase subunit 2
VTLLAWIVLIALAMFPWITVFRYINQKQSKNWQLNTLESLWITCLPSRLLVLCADPATVAVQTSSQYADWNSHGRSQVNQNNPMMNKRNPDSQLKYESCLQKS